MEIIPLSGTLTPEMLADRQKRERLFIPDACMHCLSLVRYKWQLKTCTGCGVTRYCNRTCQKKDWKAHKEFCQRMTPESKARGVKELNRWWKEHGAKARERNLDGEEDVEDHPCDF